MAQRFYGNKDLATFEKFNRELVGEPNISDDGIIDPRDTRNVLGMCLSIVNNKEVKGSEGFGVFRL